MKLDPYTLRVALDNNQAASGELYIDDGETIESVKVEEILVLGLPAKPSRVSAGKDLEWDYYPGLAATASADGTPSMLFIKNPVTSIVHDWDITIDM
jgi:hypothetical protein